MICGLSACMNNTFVHSSAKELCSHTYRHVMYYACKNTYTFCPRNSCFVHVLYTNNMSTTREHGKGKENKSCRAWCCSNYRNIWCLSVCRREAIGSLMGQLQELRSSRATDEARVGSLRRELQDTSQELRESLSRNNRQVGHTFLLTHSGKLLREDLRIS